MSRIAPILLIFVLLLAACQGNDGYAPDVPTDSPPIVARVAPTSGRVGDQIQIFGFGFTASIPENIVIIGGAATSATDYQLVEPPVNNEIEAITCTVPEGVQPGESSVAVLVHDNLSNADVIFTVLP